MRIDLTSRTVWRFGCQVCLVLLELQQSSDRPLRRKFRKDRLGCDIRRGRDDFTRVLLVQRRCCATCSQFLDGNVGISTAFP
jgi:hypothetical protein